MMRKAYRVLIADGHALLRQGIHALLRDHPDLVVVGEAANGAEALEKARQLQPNVVLVDAELPSPDGFHATRQIRAELQDTQVIVLSAKDDCPKLFRSAMEAGAFGIVTRASDIGDLIAAIRSIGHGQATIGTGSHTSLVTVLGSSGRAEDARADSPEDSLTEREQEVLQLVMQGHSNRAIASLLFISESTVRSHLHNILDKLHLTNRVQAATYALASQLRRRDLSKTNGRALDDLVRTVPAPLTRCPSPSAVTRTRRIPEAS